MNWVAISKELSGLVAKRKLGVGEFMFVSLWSGKEVQGKGELLELLQKEGRGWDQLVKLRGKKETEQQFNKTVKKRLDYVPVVTEAVTPLNTEAETEEDTEPELVELADSDDEVNDVTIPNEIVNEPDVKASNVADELEDTIPIEDSSKEDKSSKIVVKDKIKLNLKPGLQVKSMFHDEGANLNISDNDNIMEVNNENICENIAENDNSNICESIGEEDNSNISENIEDDNVNICEKAGEETPPKSPEPTTKNADESITPSVVNGTDKTSTTEKRKKRPKAGPRSKVGRVRSPSPDGDSEDTVKPEIPFSRLVGCKGFPSGQSKESLSKYFKENHVNVLTSTHWKEGELLVLFKDTESARLFSTLNYIRYLSKSISVFSASTALTLAGEAELERVRGELAGK